MTVRDGSLAVGSQLLLDLLKPAALMFSFFFVASRQQLTSIETPDICNYAHSSGIYIYTSTVYMCIVPAYAHIYVGQKHRAHWQGWTMLILFVLFRFSRRVKVSSPLNLWSDVSNEWRRANVEWLRGPHEWNVLLKHADEKKALDVRTHVCQPCEINPLPERPRWIIPLCCT